eukprot:1160513-Pelagomonas_calceolata.AAC.20
MEVPGCMRRSAAFGSALHLQHQIAAAGTPAAAWTRLQPAGQQTHQGCIMSENRGRYIHRIWVQQEERLLQPGQSWSLLAIQCARYAKRAQYKDNAIRWELLSNPHDHCAPGRPSRMEHRGNALPREKNGTKNFFLVKVFKQGNPKSSKAQPMSKHKCSFHALQSAISSPFPAKSLSC